MSTPLRPRRVVAGILRRGRRVLICQRSRAQSHPLCWEFPGGKVEPGESEPAALRRELEEELGIAAEPGPLLARLRHRYRETGEVELAFYEVAAFAGEPRNLVFEAIRWEQPERLASYEFLAADQPVLALLAPAGA